MHSADALNLHRLWRAVLNQLLSDAATYAKGRRLPVGETLQAMEAAYQDVTECGPMLRHVCAQQHDDIDAEAVAEGFRRWCDHQPAKKTG